MIAGLFKIYIGVGIQLGIYVKNKGDLFEKGRIWVDIG